MENRFLDRMVVYLGVALLFLLSYIMLRPFIMPLLWAFILGYVLRPVYKLLYKRIKRKFLCVMILLLASIFLVIIPFIFLAPVLVRQTFNFYLKVQNIDLGNLLGEILSKIVPPEFVTSFNLQIDNILSRLFSYLMNVFSSFFIDLPLTILGFFVFLYILYFVIIGFDEIEKFFSDFFPLSKESKNRFALEFKNITDGVLYGQFLIGILQGLLIGLMLFILGIEGALPLTIIAMIAGVLPLIGPAIIWVPVGLFLILTGSLFNAIILVVYSNIIVWFTDWLIKPYIVSKRTKMSISLSFISSVSGLYTFGVIGLIIGPLLISYLLIILQFYKEGRFNELFKS